MATLMGKQDLSSISEIFYDSENEMDKSYRKRNCSEVQNSIYFISSRRSSFSVGSIILVG